MKKKAAIVSGYFNPLHKGHLELFEKAKKDVDFLIVIVNNDFQRELKGSKEFMLENERIKVVSALSMTDHVLKSIDRDESVCKTLKHIKKIFGNNYNLYFVNGGDQSNKSIPEAFICEQMGIKLIQGMGEKIQSSSWLLNKLL